MSEEKLDVHGKLITFPGMSRSTATAVLGAGPVLMNASRGLVSCGATARSWILTDGPKAQRQRSPASSPSWTAVRVRIDHHAVLVLREEAVD